MITVKRYTASWCGPCKALAPIVNEIQTEMPNVNFVTIDIDLHKDMIYQDDISSVPTIIIMKDGNEVHRFTGVKPKQVITEIIKQFS
jgi:thioredoxin 1